MDAEEARLSKVLAQKRARVDAMRRRVRRYDEEYANTKRLWDLERGAWRELPRWWTVVLLVHFWFAFYAYSHGEWAFWLMNWVMFLAHWRRLYIAPRTGALALLSLVLVLPASFVWM